MPGKKYRSIKKPDAYEALRDEGKSKASAAAISNATAKKTAKKAPPKKKSSAKHKKGKR